MSHLLNEIKTALYEVLRHSWTFIYVVTSVWANEVTVLDNNTLMGNEGVGGYKYSPLFLGDTLADHNAKKLKGANSSKYKDKFWIDLKINV